MAITVAVQQGNTVVVKGDRNRLLFTKAGTLVGFTGSTVSVKRGNMVYTFDEKGRLLGSNFSK